jgi:hypothetical protein
MTSCGVSVMRCAKRFVTRREAKAVVRADPDELPLPFGPPPNPTEATFWSGLDH